MAGFKLGHVFCYHSDVVRHRRNEKCGRSKVLSIPHQRHFCRKLSQIPQDLLWNLLDGQVFWLTEKLGDQFGDVVSLDTKHIIAWVKENNLKQFVEGSHDKTKQPKGDADCKLGCKKVRHQESPSKEGKPASEKVSVSEFYWGYASGIVATKVPSIGEFVLAEITNTFDHADITYFLPLMAQVENRLGRRPTYGTADAAYDAWYTHDYFYKEDRDGFAAIPLRNLTYHKSFDENGVVLCDADLPMYLRGTYTSHTASIKHQRG